MLVFIIPVKTKAAATSWTELSKLFDRTLRSVCNQKSSDFEVMVVCNERPETNFTHPKIKYLDVNFPVPKPNYNDRVDDRAKRVVAGLLAVKDSNPDFVMSVDADDCISQNIAAFTTQNPKSYGWYVNSGYEYEEGSKKISVRRKNFHKICGTCNIINYQLLRLPETMMPYANMTGYDRFLGGHPLAKGDLAERGTPIEPLPFPGVIFVRDRAGESVSMQENVLAKFRRNPKEVLRGLKKTCMAPLNEQMLTEAIKKEFSLYPIHS
ncbi:MAG: glycosyltransferase family 2 protein [Tildeniella torsiva UHER 1998/13D]|jgi:hypothetical protein|nr:glycosyltransferase family 2 protein [Tildeniella torsiva UHER 1998/13D]